MTLVGERDVPEDVWDEAATHLSETDTVHVLMAISTINVWNRLAIATHQALPDL